MTKEELKGHAAMFSANFMWGLMSPFAKLVFIGGIVTPFVMTNLRIIGAMILFWLTSLFQPKEKVPMPDLARLFVAALLAIVFNQGCFISGVGLTSPADASIITTSMPLWVMILAAFVLKEPITLMKVAGIITGAAGAILLICGNHPVTVAGDNHVLGDLLVLTAQFSYALYLVFYKNFVSKYSMVTVMKWMFTFASLCLIPFSATDLASTGWASLSLTEVGAILFVVIGATYFTYSLVITGQRNLRPTVVGMYNYIQPIVATLLAIVLGMDSFSISKAFAVVLIFSGVYLVTRSKSHADSLQAETE